MQALAVSFVEPASLYQKLARAPKYGFHFIGLALAIFFLLLTALSALYAMLYALLQAEDYSLPEGSLLLFTLLAGAMIATRRVDWYGLTSSKAA